MHLLRLQFTHLPQGAEDAGRRLGEFQIAFQQVLVRGPTLARGQAAQTSGHVQAPAGGGGLGQRRAKRPIEGGVRGDVRAKVPPVPAVEDALAAAEGVSDQAPARRHLRQLGHAAPPDAHLQVAGGRQVLQPDDGGRAGAGDATQEHVDDLLF